MTAPLDIPVDGVTCAGCTRGIQMGLVALPEIDTVDVDRGVVHVAGAGRIRPPARPARPPAHERRRRR